MKKEILLMTLLLSAILVGAQSNNTPATAAAAANSSNHSETVAQQAASKKFGKTKAPQITFESMTVDYGTIEQGSEGTRLFKFKNTGKESLVISQCSGSCGCTVPTCPKEAFAAGKSGTIPVHYDTNRIGAFTKNVTVQTNDPTGPKVLTIRGVVEAKKP
jgi:hypothetical protein